MQQPYEQQAHCGQCGVPVQVGAVACMNCGFSPTMSRNFCQRCGSPAMPGQVACVRCGAGFGGSLTGGGDKNKVAAGVLAILLGGLGVHKFYLGYTNAGVILLAGTLGGVCLTFFLLGLLFFWVPTIIGLVEGIIYLTKSDAEFNQTYVLNKREWF
jgi:TM2 domain-containing membrane protein YozV